MEPIDGQEVRESDAASVGSGHPDPRHATVEAALRSCESLIATLLDTSIDGIFVVDDDHRVVHHNGRLLDLLRISPEPSEPLDEASLFECLIRQLEDPTEFVTQVAPYLVDPAAELSTTLRFADGRVFDVESRPHRVDGPVVGRVWRLRDRTANSRLEEELTYRAYHDPLTGLANKPKFCDRVAHAVARAERSGGRFAVLFCDIDNFKTVNDSLGHAVGDELIVAAARSLSACLRASDTAARLGGDEFAVLMEDVEEPDDPAQLATRIRDAFRGAFRVGQQEVYATISIGIAFGDRETTTEQLLRNADLAMYMAKGRGKNRFELFESEQHDAALVQVQVEAELHQAIERDEFLLFYQPIVASGSGEIFAVEALVRWEHPTRGLLLPGTFIPLAEQRGLMDTLSRELFERACSETLRIGRECGRSLRVSVNVSPAQLVAGHFVDRIASLLECTGLAPDRLILEITETAMVTDARSVGATLAAIKDLGVALALDDFGTGYSSLTFLQQFPIDIVKIDKSFVADLDEAGDVHGLAPAVITLARNLGMATVAEGVETPAQLQRLRDLGCDYLQGFLVHRPRTPESLVQILSTERPGERLAS
jgi:diguanylate cyclase (GGDEF)-like protein